MNKADTIMIALDKLFPNAKAELNFINHYELIIAVILSAQTTDVQVNLVTKNLFAKYPTFQALSKANLADVEKIIKTIGLYRNKAKYIIANAKIVTDKYDGILPNDRKILESLPGVGRKTANVVLANAFNVPTLAVDTHVYRVSIRLGLASKNDNVYQTEQKLYKIFPQDKWIKLHHQLIFFGRYICLARSPKCFSCPLFDVCQYEFKTKTLP